MGERQSINPSETLVAEWERSGTRGEALLCSPGQVQFERMPIACIIFDPQRRVLDWNPAAEQIFGYARDEGFYFQAARSYEAWFELLHQDFSRAVEPGVIDRYWSVNHEHPALMKTLLLNL